jgi:hypothetical protein
MEIYYENVNFALFENQVKRDSFPSFHLYSSPIQPINTSSTASK